MSRVCEGSIDLAWMQQAKPWQLRMAAAMMAPYNPMTAAVLYARANNLDPAGNPFPLTAESKQVM